MTATRPDVLVLTLGGTISMTGAAGQGVTPQLGAADLLASAESAAVVESRDVRTVPGAHLTYQDLAEVRAHIAVAAEAGVAGVVVVQGTDTIEEVAYVLDLVVDQPITIVVTGAMRNASAPGPDGPANLSDAIAVAADANCRGHGVLVVMAGEVHAASLVRKANTSAGHAFVSWSGPLGVVSEGRPRLLTSPWRRPAPPVSAVGVLVPSVEIVTALLGSGPRPVQRLLEDPPDGLVVAGFGGGHVPPTWVAPLAELAAERPVVLSSRTGSGPTLTATYEFAGSERDLLRRGLIGSGQLDPTKSAVLLRVLLANRWPLDELRRFFAER